MGYCSIRGSAFADNVTGCICISSFKARARRVSFEIVSERRRQDPRAVNKCYGERTNSPLAGAESLVKTGDVGLLAGLNPTSALRGTAGQIGVHMACPVRC